MEKRKEKSELYSLVIVTLSMVSAVMIWGVIWFQNAVNRMEEQNDILLQRVFDLQRIDKQKCIDLLLD
jgi:hypothetical protein